MAALPCVSNEAALRTLDTACESPSSAASTRTVVQLGKLSLSDRKKYLYNAIVWDLGHLVRCCLQELSPDTRYADRDGETALCAAARSGSVRALMVLLAAGANHKLTYTNGSTPLNAAAINNHLSCLRLLLAAGADAKIASLDMGQTPLINAIATKNADCARALIRVSDLLHVAKNGFNALHCAVITASEECFDLLLTLMEDVDVRSERNETALHLACQKCRMAMARALLKRGADRMARDNTQQTPLHIAAAVGALSCVNLLVGRPAKPLLTPAEIDEINEHGDSALHLAAYYGHEKICGVLLAMGARLDVKDDDGDTPLMCAQEGHPDQVSLHELLSGRGPANPPGTICDHCGKPAGRKMVVCSACEIVRYCDAACQLAAWEGHEAECKAEEAVREEMTSLVDDGRAARLDSAEDVR